MNRFNLRDPNSAVTQWVIETLLCAGACCKERERGDPQEDAEGFKHRATHPLLEGRLHFKTVGDPTTPVVIKEVGSDELIYEFPVQPLTA